MTPTVFLARTNMAVPIRRLYVGPYKLGTDYVLDLEVVCAETTPEARLACDQAGWLHVSSDGGSSYDPIPDDVESGVQFGPMTTGDRQAIKLKVSIPALTSVRRRFVALNFGIGT